MSYDFQMWVEFLGDVPPNADVPQSREHARPGDRCPFSNISEASALHPVSSRDIFLRRPWAV